MKTLIFIVCMLVMCAVHAQNYPFAQEFVPGIITLKDSTQKKGLIKWFPSPNENLRFKTGDAPEEKYPITDLQGFSTDSLQFKTLGNLEVYGEDFPFKNKMSKLKTTLAQVIYTGKFNIYYVLYYGYDALQNSYITYPNLIFEKTKEAKQEYAAFPVFVRMRDKKYEQAKQKLTPFFSEFPEIQEKLKQYRIGNDIFTFVDFVKSNTEDQ